jgi:single-strand DNA-binding protein
MDLNTVTISGRLTRDPELAYTKDQSPVCKFTLAVNYAKDKANFFEVSAWKGSAEACNKYLKKGSKCLVHGSLRQQTWVEKATSAKRSRVTINGLQVIFLDQRNGGAAPANGNQKETEYIPPDNSPDEVPDLNNMPEDENPF